jgi:hypothetical protein
MAPSKDPSEATQPLPQPWDGTDRRAKNDRRNEMPRDIDEHLLDQPFWKVMAFILVGLVSLAVWVMKVNIEKLEKVSDSQIETKAILKFMTEQNARDQETLKDIRAEVEQLKLNDRIQQERIDALSGRRR